MRQHEKREPRRAQGYAKGSRGCWSVLLVPRLFLLTSGAAASDDSATKIRCAYLPALTGVLRVRRQIWCPTSGVSDGS